MHAGRRGRTAAVAAAAALLLPAGAAHAQEDYPPVADPPAPQSYASFCQFVPPTYEPFSDIDDSPFKAAIECLAYAGVTEGGTSGAPTDTYGPDVVVQRDAMASLLARTMDTAAELGNVYPLEPYNGDPGFEDTTDNVHRESISRLAERGIVAGRHSGVTHYNPGSPVTRAQMGKLLAYGMEILYGQPPDTARGEYYDDDDGGFHEFNINHITTLGISNGRGPLTYIPGLGVQRDNMAEYLVRVLAWFENRGQIRPAGPAPSPGQP